MDYNEIIIDDTQTKIAPQYKYKSLEEFIAGQNNFYAHFIGDKSFYIDVYRNTAHFKRFQKLYPQFESELTKTITEIINANPQPKIPYDKLWEAYNFMSELVFINDSHIMRNNKLDNWFLCR